MSAGGEISSFGDSLFDVMRAQQEATHAAYQSGWNAGYQAGMQKALEIFNASVAARDAADAEARAARLVETELTADERASLEKYLVDVTCTACHNVKSKCTCAVQP